MDDGYLYTNWGADALYRTRCLCLHFPKNSAATAFHCASCQADHNRWIHSRLRWRPYLWHHWLRQLEMLEKNVYSGRVVLQMVSALQLTKKTVVVGTVSEFPLKSFSGIYPDLLHICDLALYTDMYASAFMVYTADRSIFEDASRDLRLRSLYRIYLEWCVKNRVLVYIDMHRYTYHWCILEITHL